MNRTYIQFLYNGTLTNKWQKFDVGYIDGYISNNDSETTCACIVTGNHVVVAQLYSFKVITEIGYKNTLIFNQRKAEADEETNNIGIQQTKT